MVASKPRNIDEYISLFPKETQKILQRVRETIMKSAPAATETINYAIPAFTLNGIYLIYFAGYKNHIGIYPAPVNEEAFKKEFSIYKTGRGSVQFPLDKPIPLSLVHKIVKFRIKKTSEKATGK